MAYSAQIVRQARQRLADAKADRESESRQRLAQAYAQLPRLKEIDVQLRRTMALAAQAVFAKGVDAAEAMAQVRAANQALQQERQALVEANFAPGYLDESPICDRCGGSGYVGTAMCRCLEQMCLEEQKRELALLSSDTERFENFRLEYYPERVDPKYGASPRAIMELTFQKCRQYADTFGHDSGNLLFVGGTGLGKTFLSACIAAQVAQKGYSVAYESASHLFSKLEKDRFNPTVETTEAVRKLTQCDLLIVDDLGTELPGQFVTAALYTLVNDRLLAGKPMVISTNLNVEELSRRYSPQIASRLQGSFRRLTFVGEDIRALKNRGI